jgi:hypothetical protein
MPDFSTFKWLGFSGQGQLAIFKNNDGPIERLVRWLQFLSPAHFTWILAANAVQEEMIGNLNIPSVLD